MSHSSSSGSDIPGWNLGHLCHKLRTKKGWSLQECAHRAGLRDHDIVAIEENHDAAADLHYKRLHGLERAFGISMLAAIQRVDDLNAPGRSQRRATSHVLRVVTASR